MAGDLIRSNDIIELFSRYLVDLVLNILRCGRGRLQQVASTCMASNGRYQRCLQPMHWCMPHRGNPCEVRRDEQMLEELSAGTPVQDKHSDICRMNDFPHAEVQISECCASACSGTS